MIFRSGRVHDRYISLGGIVGEFREKTIPNGS
jgi:hypothetical protein